MPDYDSIRFSPPAPVALVTLRNPEDRSKATEIIMLLDSGADVTLLPRSVVEKLALAYSSDAYELSDFGGGTSVSRAIRAELVFHGLTFRGQFLLMEQEWGIIGRNILNLVSLTFGGPKLSWTKI